MNKNSRVSIKTAGSESKQQEVMEVKLSGTRKNSKDFVNQSVTKETAKNEGIINSYPSYTHITWVGAVYAL